MSEMIERVANRLTQTCEAWLTISDARVLAGAVINEMREPTPEIVAEVKQAIWKNTWGDDALIGHWQKMIDAAQR